jgi:hypothetical protein
MARNSRSGEAAGRTAEAANPVDAELQAMRVISGAVSDLSGEAKVRVLRWVLEVYQGHASTHAGPTGAAAQPQAPALAAVAAVVPASKPIALPAKVAAASEWAGTPWEIQPEAPQADLNVEDLKDFFDQPHEDLEERPFPSPVAQLAVAGPPAPMPKLAELDLDDIPAFPAAAAEPARPNFAAAEPAPLSFAAAEPAPPANNAAGPEPQAPATPASPAEQQPMVSMIHGFVEEFQKLAREWDAG